MRITVFVNVMYEGPRSALSHSSISGRLFLGMYSSFEEESRQSMRKHAAL